MKTLVIVGLTLSFVACASTPDRTNTADQEAILMQLSREWSNAAGSGNLEAALAFWADDAIVMAPGQPPIRGKAAIRKFVEGSAAIPGFSIKWEPLEAHVSRSGDMAYLIERNSISFRDSTGVQVSESNKVVTVWRRSADGSWKNVIDMWNADATAWK